MRIRGKDPPRRGAEEEARDGLSGVDVVRGYSVKQYKGPWGGGGEGEGEVEKGRILKGLSSPIQVLAFRLQCVRNPWRV